MNAWQWIAVISAFLLAFSDVLRAETIYQTGFDSPAWPPGAVGGFWPDGWQNVDSAGTWSVVANAVPGGGQALRVGDDPGNSFGAHGILFKEFSQAFPPDTSVSVAVDLRVDGPLLAAGTSGAAFTWAGLQPFYGGGFAFSADGLVRGITWGGDGKAAFSLGNWHRVEMTYDMPAGQIHYYLDGMWFGSEDSARLKDDAINGRALSLEGLLLFAGQEVPGDYSFSFDNLSVSATALPRPSETPEPASGVLLGLGLLVSAVAAWRRHARPQLVVR